MNTRNLPLLLCIIVLLCKTLFVHGQQITDSSVVFNQNKADILNYLVLDNFENPAVAGSLKSYHAQVSYGNKLPGSNNAIHYGKLWLDLFFGKKQGRHGLGYRLDIKNKGFSLGITQGVDYSFQLLNGSNISLRFGAGIGFSMFQNRNTNFTFGDMIDDRFGYVYSSSETVDPISTLAFRVSSLNWRIGSQLRIFNGFVNLYYTNKHFILPELSTNPYIGIWGVNSLYNIQFKKMQVIPSLQFNYVPFEYFIHGGVLLASNTNKGGGGGIYYNNYNILSITGFFAWNDYLRVTAEVNVPFTDVRYSYPVSNFQLTVSYKIAN